MNRVLLIVVALSSSACDRGESDSGNASSSSSEGSSSEDSGGSDEPPAEYLRCNELLSCFATTCTAEIADYLTCRNDTACFSGALQDGSLWWGINGCIYNECGVDEDHACLFGTKPSPDGWCPRVYDDAERLFKDCLLENSDKCDLAALVCDEDLY